MEPFLPFLSGYFLGSLSFALLLARLKGVDLRGSGSGNPGATNAGRLMGRKTGVLVGFLDALKGFVPAWAWLTWGAEPDFAVWAALGAFMGHIWPIYYRFQGGKGLATLVGAVLALTPVTMLWSMLVFVSAVRLTKIMSVGSLALGVALPTIAWLRHEPQPIFWFALASGLFLFVTHRSNIRRLLAGEERRLGKPRN